MSRFKWFKETGLMKRDQLKWIPEKPGCEGGRRGFQTVGLNEIRPAVILLLIGYGVSVLLFIIEILQMWWIAHCKVESTPKVRFLS